MIDQMLVDTAGTAIGEIVKSALRGLGGAKEWFRATTTEHDPFGRVARRYAERMQERYGFMRIFGMPRPVPLRDIYVDVNVLPKITAQHRSTVRDLESFFERDQRRFGAGGTRVDGFELLDRKDHGKVFVLGKPGAGKTTFLRWLALQSLAGRFSERRIPLFISLKDWNDSGKELFDFAAAEFDSCGFPDASLFVRRLLETGGFLVLLDGLDEITGDVIQTTLELQRFIEQFPDNKFVISCRIAAYNHVFERFVDVEMADFTTVQVERFVRQWFAASPEKTRLFLEKVSEPKNRSIAELATTPLLLTMLCLAFDELMDFPANRSSLYAEAIDALLKKWDSSRSVRREEVYKHLSTRHKLDLLGSIAARTFPFGRYFIDQREVESLIGDYLANLPNADASTLSVDREVVLKAIEAHHGLLIERAQHIYSFSHLTFQEFFMAHSLLTATPVALTRVVNDHLLDAHWREVFLLLSEMLPNADELLRAMRLRISAISHQSNLAYTLREIHRSIVRKRDHPTIPEHVCRIAALAVLHRYLWHSLLGAGAEATKLAGAHGYQIELAKDATFVNDVPLEELLDTRRAYDLAMGGEVPPINAAGAQDYVAATRLMVDCLASDAYVTASLRKSLIVSLCQEPPNLDD